MTSDSIDTTSYRPVYVHTVLKFFLVTNLYVSVVLQVVCV